jgi:2-haloalkanoic acid dehalogenase type II
MQPPSLITFDCYGTLIDWHGGLVSTLADLGVPPADRDRLAARYVEIEMEVEREEFVPYREVMARSLTRLLEEAGRPLPSARRDALGAALPGWIPFPEVPASLTALAAIAPLGILSNIDDDLLDASVPKLGAPIAHRVTAAQVRSYKPAPGHFRKILQISGLPAGEILHVAASRLHDIVPARALGFRVLWINRTGEPVPPDLPPEIVLPDLRAAPLGAG